MLYIEGKKAAGEYRRVMSEFWFWRLREVPEFASSLGIHDHDDRLETFTVEAFRNRKVHRLQRESKQFIVFMLFKSPAFLNVQSSQNSVATQSTCGENFQYGKYVVTEICLAYRFTFTKVTKSFISPLYGISYSMNYLNLK